MTFVSFLGSSSKVLLLNDAEAGHLEDQLRMYTPFEIFKMIQRNEWTTEDSKTRACSILQGD